MERLTDARLAFPPDVWIEATRETREILSTIPIPTLRELYYRLALIEDILGDDYDLDRLRELVEADLDDRCVILKYTTVSDLRQQFTNLSSVCYGDDTETYTTGYRNGHRNGRVELLQYILGISDGAREAAETALKAREKDG